MKRERLILGHRDALNDNARVLRRAMTPAENQLWSRLRNGRIAGLRFRRQHRIEWFIVDFYCPAAKVVIEVDGASHLETAERDTRRDARLEALGIVVLRFTNQQVAKSLDDVVIDIARRCGVED